MQNRCAIVDGHSLMYRAFHALPLMDADGVYTNALHGFLSMLFRLFSHLAGAQLDIGQYNTKIKRLKFRIY